MVFYNQLDIDNSYRLYKKIKLRYATDVYFFGIELLRNDQAE